MGDTWYYVEQTTNAQTGPVTVAELGRLYASKALTDDSYMWTDGQGGWEPLSSMGPLFAKVKAAAAPAGPPVPPKGPALPPVPRKSSLANGGAASVANSYTAQGGTSADLNTSRELSGQTLDALSKAANWAEKRTADGVPYYWNAVSETVTWEKPDCLKTPEELDTGSGAWVWVSDDKEGYLPARVLKEAGDSINVQMQSGSKVTVKRAKEPLWPLKLSSLRQVEEDLVMVDDINVGLMVHCLKERYRKDQIYTWVGANHSVLVSINPFKQLPIYSPSVIEEYARPSAYRLDPPHTFAIANSAYSRLTQEGTSQAILISGESGAGKTEATKQCFNFLADTAGSANNVEQRILHANPVLEAFGNAKTLRNNNSSRFGRWTEIHFDPRAQICGARIENYLLEKQRVVKQAKGERNYHIFYQLCTSEISQLLELTGPETFRYLSTSGCISVPGVNDQKDFQEVDEAFDKLGFSLEEKCWCFETCAGVLHLGNVAFGQDGEGSYVQENSQYALHTAARFLKVHPEALALALTKRRMEIRGEVTHALNSTKQASDACDALAKAMYDNMFDWMVARINHSVEGELSNKFIGVLDIFGFEIFEKNHFEQLCINYTNEKLQQHFNKHTFQEEESVYVNEQIRFSHIEFIDNQPVVDLIEKKPYGLMPLLDEEVKVPKGGDTQWLGKCKQHNDAHPCLQNSGTNPNRFVVKHYAGDVTYDCGGFVDTNKDNLFRDLYDLAAGADSYITQSIFPPMDSNPRRLQTLGEKFRRALLHLMELVDTCEPAYIRCIKPNDNKAANTFNSRMCIEQLTYAGVFEAVQIRKSGYPFRLTHRRFANRYRCLAYKENGWVNLKARPSDHKGMCDALLRCINQDFSKVQIGNSMVLYRAEEHRILELLRNLCLERVLPVAQRAGRKKIARSFRRYMRQAKDICSRALRQYSTDAAGLDSAIAQAEQQIGFLKPCFSWEPYEMRRCRDLRFALQERVELTNLLQSLVHRDPSSCYSELRVAVQRCNKIRDIPGSPEQMALEHRARELLHQASSAKIDPIAAEALAILEKRMMEEISQEALAVEYESSDIQEIRRKLKLPEDEFVKLQLEVAKQLNDPTRVINREIKLKELYLDSNGPLFTLDKYPGLRNAEEWAAMKTYKTLALGKKKRESLAQGFLAFTTEPIHKSLTVVSGLKGDAVKQFKNLLGYCGDRKYQYPDNLARDIAKHGIENDELRGELFVQVMKQLTDNPNPSSVQRCWEVMRVLLMCFPPPKDLENYVHYFIRTHAPEAGREKFKLAVHMAVYEGIKADAPSEKDIPQMLSQFFERPITARYNIEEDVVAVRPARTSFASSMPARQSVSGPSGGAAAFASSSPYGAGSAAGTSSTPSVYTALSASYGAAAAASNGTYQAAPAAPTMAPPALPAKPSKPTARVLYDYDPAGQVGMVAVSAGQTVTVKTKDDPDWWLAEVSPGVEGWVPAAYLRLE